MAGCGSLTNPSKKELFKKNNCILLFIVIYLVQYASFIESGVVKNMLHSSPLFIGVVLFKLGRGAIPTAERVKPSLAGDVSSYRGTGANDVCESTPWLSVSYHQVAFSAEQYG